MPESAAELRARARARADARPNCQPKHCTGVTMYSAAGVYRCCPMHAEGMPFKCSTCGKRWQPDGPGAWRPV